MVFGWRPDNVKGAPIPMFYDFEHFELPQIVRDTVKIEIPAYYMGRRYKDSLEMHKELSL